MILKVPACFDHFSAVETTNRLVSGMGVLPVETFLPNALFNINELLKTTLKFYKTSTDERYDLQGVFVYDSDKQRLEDLRDSWGVCLSNGVGYSAQHHPSAFVGLSSSLLSHPSDELKHVVLLHEIAHLVSLEHDRAHEKRFAELFSDFTNGSSGHRDTLSYKFDKGIYRM